MFSLSVFHRIRSRWNSNPTALHFKRALRTLQQKNQVTAPKTGNCTKITESPEKDLQPGKRVVRLLDSSPVWRDGYIGGYIVKQLISSTKCVECVDALVAEDQNTIPNHPSYTRTSPNSSNKLIFLKSYSTLIVPSPSGKVITIC